LDLSKSNNWTTLNPRSQKQLKCVKGQKKNSPSPKEDRINLSQKETIYIPKRKEITPD